MSGSAKAGTTAERHTCELRVLIASIVRAPPKRASGESFSPLTKDLHGGRRPGFLQCRLSVRKRHSSQRNARDSSPSKPQKRARISQRFPHLPLELCVI